jgi:hypothetical protein
MANARYLADCPTCHAPAGWPCVSLEYFWSPLLPKVKTHKARTTRPVLVPQQSDTACCAKR